MHFCNKINIFLLSSTAILLTVALVLVCTVFRKDTERCTLPDNSTSTCVLIEKCITMNATLIDPRISDTDTFRQHFCGSEKICCPRLPSVFAVTDSNLVTISNKDTTLDGVTTQETVLVTVPMRLRFGYTNVTCILPDNSGSAKCIPVKECQPIINAVRGVNLTPSQREYLRSYSCGTDVYHAEVCCPQELKLNETSDDNLISTPRPSNTMKRKMKLLPEQCGVADAADRVRNGNETNLYEFPWMALLYYSNIKGRRESFRCGGTIINSRYILTAAHCVVNRTLFSVRVGEYKISSQLDCIPFGNTKYCAPLHQDKDIEKIIDHPNYNDKTYIHDIALIRLQSDIIFNENTQPICLPMLGSLQNANYTQSSLIVTGWGITDPIKGTSSDVLLKASIPMISNNQCQSLFKKRVTINNGHLCALDKNGRDSCKGDSGGPLQRQELLNGDYRFVQVGVVSFGPWFCGDGKTPGVYTRTDYYMDWILDNMLP